MPKTLAELLDELHEANQRFLKQVTTAEGMRGLLDKLGGTPKARVSP